MKLIIFLTCFAAIAVIGNYFATLKMEKVQQKYYWLKLVVYLLWLLSVLLGSWAFNWFFIAMAVGVSFIGLLEIIRYTLFVSLKDYFSLALYFVIAVGYIAFYVQGQDKSNDFYRMVFILIGLFDGFSQISGQLFGKIKILKRISPSKTLEGYLGGLIILFFSAWLLNFEDHEIYNLNWVQMTLIVGIGAPIGDFLSSCVKRHFAIKDFGTYFPGQGGVLDRYDSHIFTGALFFIIMQLLKNHA